MLLERDFKWTAKGREFGLRNFRSVLPTPLTVQNCGVAHRAQGSIRVVEFSRGAGERLAFMSPTGGSVSRVRIEFGFGVEQALARELEMRWGVESVCRPPEKAFS